MKRLLLLPVFLLLALCTQSYAQSAITLTSANIPLPMGDVQNYILTTATVAPAPVGNNMTWNYGAVTVASLSPYSYMPATNVNFSPVSVHDTLNFDQLAQGYGILYNQYIEKTKTGILIDGLEFPKQAYSVAPVSGNAADSIWVPAQAVVYPDPAVYLTLPATAGSNWTTSSLRRTLRMQLTLAGYGINKAEFDKSSTLSRTNTVVGWGTLVLPAQSGTQNIPALMVKREDIRIDSFTLGGQPAPPALLSAFGLAQGMVTKSYKQLFHVEGMMLPIMVIGYSDNTYSTVVGSSLYEMASLGVSASSAPSLANVYPNPVIGNDLHIALGSEHRGTMRVELADIMGRVVATNKIAASNAVADLSVPSSLANGQYFVRVIGESGKLLRFAKVMVSR